MKYALRNVERSDPEQVPADEVDAAEKKLGEGEDPKRARRAPSAREEPCAARNIELPTWPGRRASPGRGWQSIECSLGLKAEVAEDKPVLEAPRRPERRSG